jgi:hypothetical protein
VKRREVIALFGAAAAWPLAALAQQSEKMRRIGVLSSLAETDAEAQAWDAAFCKRLVELGWIDGRNIRIDPNELAVQQPTRFELVVNAKTAKMLGLTIPTSMLVAAHEVIE